MADSNSDHCLNERVPDSAVNDGATAITANQPMMARTGVGVTVAEWVYATD
jgi:hypothetical protein